MRPGGVFSDGCGEDSGIDSGSVRYSIIGSGWISAGRGGGIGIARVGAGSVEHADNAHRHRASSPRLHLAPKRGLLVSCRTDRFLQ